MDIVEFGENIDGVHLMNILNPEYTLCGEAFDMDSEDDMDEDYRVYPTHERIVTCENCIRVILSCKDIKIGKKGRQ